MPLDPRAKRFLDTLAAMNPPGALSLSAPQRRDALKHLLSFSGAAGGRSRPSRSARCPGPGGALAVRLYTPTAARSGQRLPGLIYFHGGGLVAGTLDTHDPICRSLANASGCRVVSVDYRLAPETRFPAALEDGYAATVWIAKNADDLGIDAAAARHLRRLGRGHARGSGLSESDVLAGSARWRSSSCCVRSWTLPRRATRAAASRQGYLLDQETLEHDLKYYLAADTDPADPRVSPLRAVRPRRSSPDVDAYRRIRSAAR